MRKSAMVLAAFIAVGAPLVAASGASAQATRPEETPGNKPVEFLQSEQQTQMRAYMRAQRRGSSAYEGDVRMGSRLPDTMTYYRFSNPEWSRYRYTRLNNRDVILDETGRVVDLSEISAN
jgi:hypothetical protein